MKNFKKIAFGLLVGALAIGFSAFTNIKKQTDTTWHISSINGSGNYVVTTSGECQLGSDPCTFTTSLAPDKPGGTYSPAFLAAHDVEVDEGSFSNN